MVVFISLFVNAFSVKTFKEWLLKIADFPLNLWYKPSNQSDIFSQKNTGYGCPWKTL